MEINYFDLVVTVVILLLGLKGVINGLFKEVFGLIGIIGGIFIASRLGDSVGSFLNSFVNFNSPAAVSFMGFLSTLIVFWAVMLVMGMMFKKLTAMSGLGPIDKILGFVFGASKFFLIAAVIAHAVYSVKAIKSVIDTNMSSSVLFPIMAETGSYIMQIDPVGITSDLNTTINETKDALQETATQAIQSSAQKSMKEIEDTISQTLQSQTPQKEEK